MAYCSWKLSGAEARDPAIAAEASAVVVGDWAFDPYSYGHKFTIYADHKPFMYLPIIQ